MGFITWLKDPGLRGEMLWLAISADDPEEVAEALNELSEKGWLTDSSMRGVDLHEAGLQNADISGADLADGDFHAADLRGVDFSGANLRWAVFDQADLTGANLQDTDLRGASLARAKLDSVNLQDADLGGADLHSSTMVEANTSAALLDEAELRGTGLTEAQLLQASTLAEATLPDGKKYDGRYNLSGDLEDAVEVGADLDSVEDMASFYGVTVEKYQEGQEWAKQNKRGRKSAAVKKAITAAAEKHVSDDEDDDDGPVEGLFVTVTNPISYVDMMDMPFDDPETLGDMLDDDEQEDKLRGMAAWLGGLLMWLAPVIVAIEQLLVIILRPRGEFESQDPWFIVTSGANLLMIIMAIIITAKALQATGRAGLISRILAVVLAVLLGGGFALSGPLVAFGYAIALLMSYVYLGRNARLTLFWLSSALMAPSMGAVFAYIAGLVGLTEFPLWMSIVLLPLRYVLGIVVIAFVRYIIRTHAVNRIGRRHAGAIIRELQIGYVVSIVLALWAAVVNFATAMRPPTDPF